MNHAGHQPDHPLERMIFFSDAVFAIAITLLIIEVHPPHLPFGSPWQAYVAALVQLLPNFLGFFVSFFVIGAFWAGHHRAFGLARHYSEALISPNLALLCAIVFLPFSTAFMSANAGMIVPSVVYAATLIVSGLLSRHLTRLATSAGVVRDDVTRIEIDLARNRSLGVVLGALLSLAIAFVDARFSQAALLTIPLFQAVNRRLIQRRLRSVSPERSGTMAAG